MLERTKITTILLLVIVVFFSTFWGVRNEDGILFSPDEVTNYLTVHQYAEEGKFGFANDYLEYDYGNNLHPRGFITVEGEVVTFNFLGTAVFYSPYVTLWQEAPFALAVVLLILLICHMYGLFNEWFGKDKNNLLYVLIALLGCSPVIHYYNYPYLNVLGSGAFFITSLYYLVCFSKKDGNGVNLVLGTLFGVVAIWFRYENALFWGFSFILALISKKQLLYRRKSNLVKVIGGAVLVGVLTGIPILILNNDLYGSPLVYGYSALSRVLSGLGGGTESSISIMSFLIRAEELNVRNLFVNIIVGFFLLSPVFFTVGFAGLIRNRVWKKMSWFLIVLAWIVLYTGMSGTYNSGVISISLFRSVFRYWFVVYVILAVIVAYTLRSMERTQLRILAIVLILFGGVLSTLYVGLFPYRFVQSGEARGVIEEYRSVGEEGAYIICPSYDKFLFREANVITWWGGSGNFDRYYDPEQISDLASVLLENGESVYAFESLDYSEQHIRLLEGDSLKVLQVSDHVYKVEKVE